MIELSCPCGQVRVAIEARPEFIHECNCSLCTRADAQWGYFDPSLVRVEGSTEGYSRDDKDEPAAEVRTCTGCGGTTHFVLTESAMAKFGNSVMGVNMRLADERDLAGIELRYPDGKAWAGEGEFGYVRGPRLIGG